MLVGDGEAMQRAARLNRHCGNPPWVVWPDSLSYQSLFFQGNSLAQTACAPRFLAGEKQPVA
jgi:hypothetical protein